MLILTKIFSLQGSALCPLGQSVMGGAFTKSEGAVLEPKVLADGRVVPPTPAQQAVHMANFDIYNFQPSLENSDDEPLSDMD